MNGVAPKTTYISERAFFLASSSAFFHRVTSTGPTIQFKNGVLSYTERFWTTSDNDVADALFGAVSTLNSEGFSVCTVTADTQVSPSINSQRVWIACGEKSALVVKRSFGGHSYNSVYEQLGKYRTIE